jgi:hypothetical protein
MTTATAPAFGTHVVGQTENALGAILDRQLAGTGVTAHQWVALTLTVVGGGTADAGQLAGRVAGVLKVGEPAARELIGELVAAGLLTAGPGDVVEVSRSGRELFGETRTAVGHITQRLWGDLPQADLETAGRVLSTVLARANDLLAEDQAAWDQAAGRA